MMGMDAKTTSVYTDFSELARLKYQSGQGDQEANKAVAKQFEALFVQMMLQSMRDAANSMSSDLFDSKATQFYQGMFDKQIALDISNNGGGIGLADVIAKQLGVSDGINKNTDFDPRPKNITEYFAKQANMPAPFKQEQASVAQFVDKVKAAYNTYKDTFNSPKDFIKTLWPHALDVANKLGVNPKVVVAQAALETGWGKHLITHQDGRNSHNLFGIKASKNWQQDKTNITTHEYTSGKKHKVQDDFRSYQSYAESFADYANLLMSNNRYQKVLNSGDDVKRFAEGLQKAGYATDPSYAKKIMSIINSSDMQQALKEL